MGINEVVQIGNRIKEYRKSKGFTQRELALRANIPYSTYSNYENNNREPNREQLQKIATALNVPLYELMGFDGSIRVNVRKQQPFDIAIQKFQNKEDLTYEEEDIIREYVESEQFKQEKDDIKQIAQKAYNYISFMHSHSYASSAEDIGEQQDAKQIELEKKRTRPLTAPLSQNNKDNGTYIDSDLQKLYEIAIEKAVRHEELTEEEEQVIIGIPGQLRQKSDSYENSYSFASSEELNKILKQRQKQREELLLNDYRKLNKLGQLEARKRVSELTEIPRYTKPDEPPQE